MAPPSKYSPEFKEETVQIALRSSKTISETARELGLNPETLRGWVKKHEKRNAPSANALLTLDERARLKEAERRVRQIRRHRPHLHHRRRDTFRRPGAGLLKTLREHDPDHALLDGTLSERDRPGDGRTDHSHKQRRHGVNARVVTDPDPEAD